MAARDDRGESRRQIARRQQRKVGDRSARLANALMKLSASALGKLGLDEDLRASVDRARAVTAHVARRRAERTLAGDLRRIDLVALDARLARAQTGTAEQQQLHLAEQWRVRMIEGGLAAAAEFPGGVTEPLPHLIESAQREWATGKPPGAARALFRHIAAVLKAQVAAPVASGEDATTDGDKDADDEPE